jgi:simple sugar transport system substrate-binding protein/ribose transport system substrate-binding protein
MSARRVTWLLPVLAATVALAGCGSADSSGRGGGASKSKAVSIGVIVPDTSIPWFTTVQKGVEHEAQQLDAKVSFANTNLDAATETKNLETLVARGVDVVAISALNSDTSVPVVQRIAKQDVPVVEWNNTLNSDAPKAFVGIDNRQYGRVAGEDAAKYINEHLNGKATIAVLGDPRSSAIDERIQGFRDGLKGAPGAKVVTTQPGALPEDALKAVESILGAHPDLDMVYATNEGGALGAVRAIRGQKKTGSVALVALDFDKTLVAELHKPDTPLKIVVSQDPYRIGAATAQVAVKVARGQKVPAKTLVQVDTITQDNLAAYLKSHVLPG